MSRLSPLINSFCILSSRPPIIWSEPVFRLTRSSTHLVASAPARLSSCNIRSCRRLFCRRCPAHDIQAFNSCHILLSIFFGDSLLHRFPDVCSAPFTNLGCGFPDFNPIGITNKHVSTLVAVCHYASIAFGSPHPAGAVISHVHQSAIRLDHCLSSSV